MHITTLALATAGLLRMRPCPEWDCTYKMVHCFMPLGAKWSHKSTMGIFRSKVVFYWNQIGSYWCNIIKRVNLRMWQSKSFIHPWSISNKIQTGRTHLSVSSVAHRKLWFEHSIFMLFLKLSNTIYTDLTNLKVSFVTNRNFWFEYHIF